MRINNIKSVSTYISSKFLDIKLESKQDNYQNFIDSYRPKEEELFFNLFKNEYDEFRMVENISFNEMNFYSFLNFVRYQQYLKEYLKKITFYSNWNNGILSINFESRNNTGTNLQLIFQEDGIVSFLSLDRDIDDEETLCYVIDGTFSSSNMTAKSYKIKRLLGILMESMNEENSNKSIVENNPKSILNVNEPIFSKITE